MLALGCALCGSQIFHAPGRQKRVCLGPYGGRQSVLHPEVVKLLRAGPGSDPAELEKLMEPYVDGWRSGGLMSKWVLNQLADSGELDLTMWMLSHMQSMYVDTDVDHYTSVVKACRTAGEWETVFALLGLMQDESIAPSERTFAQAIRACGDGHQWESAVALFDSMPAQQVAQSLITFSLAIHACAPVGQWESAFQLLQGMKDAGIQPDEIAYEAFLQVCAKSLKESSPCGATQAFAVLSEMQSAGVEPTVTSLRKAIDIGKHHVHWESVLSTLDLMQSKSVALDEGLYKDAIELCIDAGEGDWALTLLEDARSAGIAPESGRNAQAFRRMAFAACGVAARWETALDMLSSMSVKRVGLDPRHLEFTIDACGRSGCWEHVAELLESSQAARNSLVCRAAISAYGSNGQWERALSVLQIVKRSRSMVPHNAHFGSAINACGSSGRCDLVAELLDSARNMRLELTSRTYLQAIRAYGANGMWEDAVDMLSVMESEALSIDEFDYASAISACGEAGQWEKVLHMLDSVRRHDIAPESLGHSAAIRALGDASQWQRSLVLLSDLTGQATANDYAAAISACGRGGQLQLALDLIGAMQSEGVTPSLGSYQAAMTACGCCEQWEPVLELLSTLRREGLMPKEGVFLAAIKACVQAKSSKGALGVLDVMHEISFRQNPRFQREISQACQEVGLEDLAPILMMPAP
eukprot:TRINITY_DN33245_c0_g1_i1.p1 TRINITY_DN33245_c0_g1~~TRINITY_DN33245_c0_g1_i1.p1  ORF type:complete len:708 (-),score=100.26 TRINITY_DN33245_c0_g1_i1:107-2200(-)